MINKKNFLIIMMMVAVLGIVSAADFRVPNDLQLFGNEIKNGTMNWTSLKNYPLSCPTGTYVTAINDSVTCTGVVGTGSGDLSGFVDADFTGTVTAENVNGVYYVQAGNATDIQTKINLCSSGGCNIILPKGIYELDDTLNIPYQGIVIKGQYFGGQKYNYDEAVTLIPSSSFDSSNNLINITGYRSGLENLYIEGNYSANDGVYLAGGANYIKYSHVSSFNNNGITIPSAGQDSESFIEYVWSGNNLNNGIEINRADFDISHVNVYRNWHGAGIYINSGANRISNSYIWGNNYSVYILGGDSNMVFNNILAESLEAAIYFDSSTGEPFRHTIIGNTFLRGSFNQTIFDYDSSLASTSTNLYPFINFDDSSGNGISAITISSNNFDSSTHLFNYSGSTNIEKIGFFNNAYTTVDFGEVPSNLAIQDFNTVGGSVSFGDGINNQDMIYFNSERPWKFTAGNTGGSTTLDLQTENDGKEFRILSPVGSVVMRIRVNDVTTNSQYYYGGLTGTNNDFVCIDANELLYRSDTACS